MATSAKPNVAKMVSALERQAVRDARTIARLEGQVARLSGGAKPARKTRVKAEGEDAPVSRKAKKAPAKTAKAKTAKAKPTAKAATKKVSAKTAKVKPAKKAKAAEADWPL